MFLKKSDGKLKLSPVKSTWHSSEWKKEEESKLIRINNGTYSRVRLPSLNWQAKTVFHKLAHL